MGDRYDLRRKSAIKSEQEGWVIMDIHDKLMDVAKKKQLNNWIDSWI